MSVARYGGISERSGLAVQCRSAFVCACGLDCGLWFGFSLFVFSVVRKHTTEAAGRPPRQGVEAPQPGPLLKWVAAGVDA
jgi:hypothetical protein